MEQHLRLYRNHTPACIHGYRKPIFEGEKTAPDCTCPINATGYLRNECDEAGKAKRILHRSLGTKDWAEANRLREVWLTWGQTKKPKSDSELANRADVTVSQAVEFWYKFSAETHTKGDSTQDKYRILLNLRFLPWCADRKKRLIAAFDDGVTVKQFFMSWSNLQPARNKTGVKINRLHQELSHNTKRAELERFRTFLEFCKQNGWLKVNYAKAPYIKLGVSRIKEKMAFTMDEYQNIIKTLDTWKDRYYKTRSRAAVQRAFALVLRYTGQRLSDAAMLGPDNIVEDDGNFFVALTQVKTGSFVKIPVPFKLVETLRALPIMGETQEPFVLIRPRWTITYGTQFWFWTANLEPDASGERINQVIESTLRANIDETEFAAIITEQGGRENHRERNQDCSSLSSQFG